MQSLNSQDFQKLIDDTKRKVIRQLCNNNLSLTDTDIDFILEVVENAVRTCKIDMQLSLPKKSPSLKTITCLGNKVAGYHYVDGLKRQIVQVLKDDIIYYYTDGVEEKSHY